MSPHIGTFAPVPLRRRARWNVNQPLPLAETSGRG